MRYRGFEIAGCEDRGIEHVSENGESEICEGYFCQVYPASDEDYAYELDCFCLAAGHEIPATSEQALEKGIISYVDDMYSELSARKAELDRERKVNLIGRLVSWLGETENGQELYDTLTQSIGMTDDEIREIGFASLAPYFDRDGYAKTIAEHYIDAGSEKTRTGNWYLYFEEINERYKTNLPSDKEMAADIADHLKKGYPYTVRDAVLADDGIFISFQPDLCPLVERDWDQEPEEELIQQM